MLFRNLSRSNAVLLVANDANRWTIDLADACIRQGLEVTWIKRVEAVPRILGRAEAVTTLVIAAGRLNLVDRIVLGWCRSRTPSIAVVVATIDSPTLETLHAIHTSAAEYVHWPATADALVTAIRRARTWKLN